MIRVCGWDVGIRHLAFCEAIIPKENFDLEHLQITNCGFIDLQVNQEALIYQWPSSEEQEQEQEQELTHGLQCCKLSSKNKECKAQPRWVLHTKDNQNSVYCARHQKDEKSMGNWWTLFGKGKNKKPKLGLQLSARHIVVDSSIDEDEDEENVKNSKIHAKCGICFEEFYSVRQPFWVHRPIDNWDGPCVHPICFKCARAELPENWKKWPFNNRFIESRNNDSDQLLLGPPITETDAIMQKLVRCLKGKWSDEIDIVWIENQPTLVNPKMKSLQMILYTHFQSILSDKGGSVRFVNPNQKWKEEVHLESSYRVHKQNSVSRFIDWLQSRGEYEDFLTFYGKQKKKDDMADAFWIIAANLSEWKVNSRFLSNPEIDNEV